MSKHVACANKIRYNSTVLYFSNSFKYDYGINADFNPLWQRNAPLVLVIIGVFVVTRGREFVKRLALLGVIS